MINKQIHKYVVTKVTVFEVTVQFVFRKLLLLVLLEVMMQKIAGGIAPHQNYTHLFSAQLKFNLLLGLEVFFIFKQIIRLYTEIQFFWCLVARVRIYLTVAIKLIKT